MDIQMVYYDNIPYIDNPRILDEECKRDITKVNNRRDCIQKYAEFFQYYKPCLFLNLINIYFNPEVTVLLEKIKIMPDYKRKYYLILKTVLDKHRSIQFPNGDISSKLVKDFINEILISNRLTDMTLSSVNPNPFDDHGAYP